MNTIHGSMLKKMAMCFALALLCACNSEWVKPRVFREVCREVEEDEPAISGDETNLQQRVIGPGMQLSVYVAEDNSLSRGYPVPLGCAVDFAGVGRIKVCGLKTDEVASKIKAALERDYFQQATVEVTIEPVQATVQAAGVPTGVVYVLGAVNRPGPMRVAGDDWFTVTKAIIAAGGFTTFAKGGDVKVVRYCKDGRRFETTIDVAGIMKSGRFDEDVPLRPEDWVIVPEKLLSFF